MSVSGAKIKTFLITPTKNRKKILVIGIFSYFEDNFYEKRAISTKEWIPSKGVNRSKRELTEVNGSYRELTDET